MGEEQKIIDTARTDGTTDTLEADLLSAVNLDAPASDTAPPTGDKPDWIQDKFWTGDVNESAQKQTDSFSNLQTAYGRMANDLGTQRKLTDRLLEVNVPSKREQDLVQNTPQHAAIEGVNLIDQPTETLDSYFEPRLAQNNEAMNQRLAQMENVLQQNAFKQVHPDAEQIGADPAFSQWISNSAYRQRAAQAGIAGDWTATDELLTEWKLTQASQIPVGDPGVEAEAKALQAARDAGLENSSSNSAGTTTSGKTYKRQELIQLKLEKPHVYEDPRFQAEILAAYAEGRVK